MQGTEIVMHCMACKPELLYAGEGILRQTWQYRSREYSLRVQNNKWCLLYMALHAKVGNSERACGVLLL